MVIMEKPSLFQSGCLFKGGYYNNQRCKHYENYNTATVTISTTFC